MHSFQKYLIIFFISSVNAELVTVNGSLDEAVWGNASEINEYFETVPFCSTILNSTGIGISPFFSRI